MQSRMNFSPNSLRAMTTMFAATLALVTVLSSTVLQSGTTLAGASTGAPRCTTRQLVVWLNTTGNGAAGSSYYNLEFTNLSAHACALSGFPGVSAINVADQQIGSAAGHNAEHAPALITLSSGAANRKAANNSRACTPFEVDCPEQRLPRSHTLSAIEKDSRVLKRAEGKRALTQNRWWIGDKSCAQAGDLA